MHFVFVVVGGTSGKACVRTLVNNLLFVFFLKGISGDFFRAFSRFFRNFGRFSLLLEIKRFELDERHLDRRKVVGVRVVDGLDGLHFAAAAVSDTVSD